MCEYAGSAQDQLGALPCGTLDLGPGNSGKRGNSDKGDQDGTPDNYHKPDKPRRTHTNAVHPLDRDNRDKWDIAGGILRNPVNSDIPGRTGEIPDIGRTSPRFGRRRRSGRRAHYRRYQWIPGGLGRKGRKPLIPPDSDISDDVRTRWNKERQNVRKHRKPGQART